MLDLSPPPLTYKDIHAMKISQMLDSKYLKQEDVDADTPVTVKKITKVNIARDDAEPEYKWAVSFNEFERPLLLNKTNLKRMAKALGDDSDDWIGNQVVLYVDEDVEYAGEVVGGLRIRAMKREKPSGTRRVPSADGTDDDIPF